MNSLEKLLQLRFDCKLKQRPNFKIRFYILNNHISEIASMISPIHRNSMASCVFEFWYYIAGITTDLQPVLKSKNLNKDLILDKLKPDSESVGLWRKSVNGIGRQREDFQLRISLEPSKTFDAGVAIDDLGKLWFRINSVN